MLLYIISSNFISSTLMLLITTLKITPKSTSKWDLNLLSKVTVYICISFKYLGGVLSQCNRDTLMRFALCFGNYAILENFFGSDLIGGFVTLIVLRFYFWCPFLFKFSFKKGINLVQFVIQLRIFYIYSNRYAIFKSNF